MTCLATSVFEVPGQQLRVPCGEGGLPVFRAGTVQAVVVDDDLVVEQEEGNIT